MENIGKYINLILPWVLFIILLYFTLVLISYAWGVHQAKQADDTLQLALSKTGKIVMGILYGLYFIILIGTLTMEINIFKSGLKGTDLMVTALNGCNLLTIVTFIAAIETQDIFFIGKKNIFIGNRMFEIRRMRKMSFPKKHSMAFIYGQKEYTYSTRFIDIPTLKAKFTKLY